MPDRPSEVRAQLGSALRACRRLSGLDQRALASRLGVSQSMVSRIEAGGRLLSRPEIQRWLRITAAPLDRRDLILTLAQSAHSETQSWDDALGGRAHLQDAIRQRNTEARAVMNFQPTIVPGLLQTAEYARTVIPLADITGTVDHDAALAARVNAQGVLREPGRAFSFLITERLLRWEPAPGVLAPQLAHLRSAMDQETVSLGILPDGYADALPWHNFVIRHPADAEAATFVTVELIGGPQRIEGPEEVAVYVDLWDRLWKAALTGDDARALLGGPAAAGRP